MTGAKVSILNYGARALRRRAEPVDAGASGTADLLDRLWAALESAGGVGLAAPQLGENARVVVVRYPKRPRGSQRIDLVNPRIVESFGPDEPFQEGCLSFPGLYTTVLRPKGVVVEFDAGDERRTIRDEGILARIVQHEIDHLDGVLFIDHLTIRQKLEAAPRLLGIIVTGWFRTWVTGRKR